MKVISVPLDQAAADRLDRGEEREGDLMELQIPQEEFPALFSSGWVHEVNSRLGCLIDEFEDAQIAEAPKLKTLLEITKPYADTHGGVFLQIPRLVEEAFARQTGLYFYF